MPIHHAELYVEKRLSTRERSEPEAILRLRSEAALLAHLGATGVTPRLLARGEDETGPWHRIERVRLPTVAERLAATTPPGTPLPAAWIEHAARACLAALATLHAAADERGPLELVHADLSPANIAIDDLGVRVVVLDFDLACWRDGPRRDGAFRGTIAYTAPEIARGELPTARSDLFSLAAVLLHCMTGRPPRSGPSFAALLAIAAEAELISAQRPEYAALAQRGPGHAAVLSCLALDPASRPGSAQEVLSDWPSDRSGGQQ